MDQDQDAPRWPQDGPKTAPRWPKLVSSCGSNVVFSYRYFIFSVIVRCPKMTWDVWSKLLSSRFPFSCYSGLSQKIVHRFELFFLLFRSIHTNCLRISWRTQHDPIWAFTPASCYHHVFELRILLVGGSYLRLPSVTATFCRMCATSVTCSFWWNRLV